MIFRKKGYKFRGESYIIRDVPRRYCFKEETMMKLLKRIAVLSLCVLAVSGCTKSSITTEAPVVQEPAAEEVVMPDSIDPEKFAVLETQVEVVEKVELVEEEEYEETMFDWEQVDAEAEDLFGDKSFYPATVKMEYAADEEALTVDLTWVLANGTTEDVAMKYATELVQKFNDILAVQVADMEFATATSFGSVWETFALTVKVGTEDGNWMIDKSYAAGEEIDLELPEYSGEGPAVNGPAEKVSPSAKN